MTVISHCYRRSLTPSFDGLGPWRTRVPPRAAFENFVVSVAVENFRIALTTVFCLTNLIRCVPGWRLASMREQQFKRLECYPLAYPIYYNDALAGPYTLCLSLDHRKRRALLKYVSAYGVDVRDVISFGSREDYGLLCALAAHRRTDISEFAPENLSFLLAKDLAVSLNLSEDALWQRIRRCRDHLLKATDSAWSVAPKSNELIETSSCKGGYRLAPDVRFFEHSKQVPRAKVPAS